MRLEYVPIIFGAIIALCGVGLVADAWLPDGEPRLRERRRRERAERHRGGETMIGLGVALLGVTIIVRDSWSGVLWAVVGAGVLLAIGALLNRHYLVEQLHYRGRSRRDPTTDHKPGMPEKTPPGERYRVR